MQNIDFGPNDIDLSLYSGDTAKISYKILNPDNTVYTTTGSWQFKIYDKTDESEVDVSPTGISIYPEYNSYLSPEYTYTSAADQDTFSGVDDNGDTLAYNVGDVEVYKNTILVSSSEYTATNGTSIVLDTAASENDIIKIVALNYTEPSGIAEVTVSKDLTDELFSTASPVYEFSLVHDGRSDKFTFIKGGISVDSKFSD